MPPGSEALIRSTLPTILPLRWEQHPAVYTHLRSERCGPDPSLSPPPYQWGDANIDLSCPPV